ncbi:leucine-rich repeat domain-containing protein [Microcystis aeruginosa]|uniref:leucine-rich repeat domain-containing protein n=1 Tax=Microcystis aeruginosa TaxID=1126 RepID=UPI002FEE5660
MTKSGRFQKQALAQLTSLQVLYLNNNQISEIPEALAHLVNLKRLFLENNPITNVPPEIRPPAKIGTDYVQ